MQKMELQDGTQVSSNESNHYNLSNFKHSKTIIGNPISLNSSIKMNLGIREASDIYGKRMHNLCCDNCHSHVATALGRIIACLSKRTKKEIQIVLKILFTLVSGRSDY